MISKGHVPYSFWQGLGENNEIVLEFCFTKRQLVVSIEVYVFKEIQLTVIQMTSN